MIRRLVSSLAALALLLPGAQAYGWSHGTSGGGGGGNLGGIRALIRRVSVGPQAFHGPGSRGFLATCSANFSVSNYVEQSNAFNTSPWALANSGVAAPTITSTTALAPDNTNTATTISFPATSVAGNYTQINQHAQGPTADLPNTGSVWVQITSSSSNGTIYYTENDGVRFVSQPVQADGRWHFIVNPVPGGLFAVAPYVEIGIDLRTGTGNVGNTGTVVANVWDAQVSKDRGPAGGQWPYQATTAAAVTNTLLVNCPNTIAFRDFTHLLPYTGNPTITQNASYAYQAGGVSNAYMPGYYAGGKYYGLINATDTNNHSNWLSFGLYGGPNPFQMTEVTANTPILQAFGSNFTGTRGTTAINHYLLHAAAAPSGCTVSAVLYAYCFYFEAMNSSNNMRVYMGFSNTLAGPYTVYPSGAAPTALVNSGSSGISNEGLPSIIQVGSTYYMYTSNLNNSGTTGQVFWTSSVSDGLTWSEGGFSLQAPLVSDWDAATVGEIDPQVAKNGCGFYEYLFTAQKSTWPNSKTQVIGYAVSDDPRGPWFKYSTYIIPTTSSMYAGAAALGDPSTVVINKKFFFVANYDNGTSISSAVAATMSDACSY